MIELCKYYKFNPSIKFSDYQKLKNMKTYYKSNKNEIAIC